jgi:hypothetical protein
MICEDGMRRAVLTGICLLSSIGCGNYSNEDLEYMNALPEKQDLAAELPEVRQGQVAPAEQAELYKTTRGVIQTFNGTLDALLSLVEAVRQHSPTSREPDARVWGPFADSNNPGWLARVRIERDPAASGQFRYFVQFRHQDAAAGAWISVMTGDFQSTGGIRRGVGHLTLSTRESRAAGLFLKFDNLDQLMVTYNTMGAPTPVTVDMELTSLPDPFNPAALTRALYSYTALESGQGQMQFDFWANALGDPVLSPVEKFVITSDWLATGEGRAESQIVEGDGTGSRQVSCWAADFRVVFNDKPWARAEDTGSADACPVIPAI